MPLAVIPWPAKNGIVDGSRRAVTEGQTQTGRKARRMKMANHAYATKTLFLVQYRHFFRKKLSEISDLEIASTDYGEIFFPTEEEQKGIDGLVYFAGHESGIRARHPNPILTWSPEPGDKIIRAVLVEFDIGEKGEYQSAHWTDPYTQNPRKELRIVHICCETTDSRVAGLGDDTIGEAEVTDAIAEQVAAGLLGDWRVSQCSISLKEEGGRHSLSRAEANKIVGHP
jgi:hypothetical protein